MVSNTLNDVSDKVKDKKKVVKKNNDIIIDRGVQNRILGRPGSGNPGTRFFGYLKL